MNRTSLHLAPLAICGGRGVPAGGMAVGIAPAGLGGIAIALRSPKRRFAAFQSS